jgi:hypothetical protein
LKPLAFLAFDCHDAHHYFRFFIRIWGFASEQGILGRALHRLSARGRRRDLGFHLEPYVVTEHGEVTWQTDSEFMGANHAEHAMVGDYELLVFDLPADRAGRAIIGWELFGPPRHQELIAQGEAQTFDDAKAATERAFDKL